MENSHQVTTDALAGSLFLTSVNNADGASNSVNTMTFSQLASGAAISIPEGQLSVIESDGQQYLILPNFTVGNDQQLIFQNHQIPQDAVSLESNQQPQLNSEDILQLQIPAVDQPTEPEPILNNHITNIQKQLEENAALLERIPPPTLPKLPSASGMIHFHESMNKKSEGLPNGQLDIPDIIPSFFKRTILQDTETGGSKACSKCGFKAETLQQLKEHKKEHKETKKNSKLRKKVGGKIPRKKGRPLGAKKKKPAQMIRTLPSPSSTNFPPKCHKCQIDITSAHQYRKHMKIHEKEKPFSCDECSESFNKEYNLQLHKSIHNSESENGKYECPECKKMFGRMAGLKMHITVHAEDENFICTECGDEFASNDALTSHITEHNNDLERHLQDKNKYVNNIVQSVSISPPFEESPSVETDPSAIGRTCSFCKKVFQRKSQLKRHLRIHTGEKPYRCPICDKAFNQKESMQTHMSMHSGEKPHMCPHCPQTYRQRGNLKIHIARVHPFGLADETTFKCYLCPCIFRRLGSLNAHITKYHTDQTMIAETDMLSILKERDKKSTLNKKQGESAVEEHDELQKLIETVLKGKTYETENMDPVTDIVHQALEKSNLGTDSTTFSEIDTTDLELSTNQFINVEEQTTKTATTEAQQQEIVTNVPVTAVSGIEQSLDINPAPEQVHIPSPVPATRNQTEPIPATVPVQFETSTIQQQPAVVMQEKLSVVNATSDQQASVSTAPSDIRKIQPSIASLDVTTFRPSISLPVKNTDVLWRIRRIDNVRYHECLVCSKVFKKPSDLARHIRIHTLERPYKCNVCSRAFTVKSSLISHTRTHLGIKPYKCQVCHKSFSTAGSLKVHMRNHTGAKPFACHICNKSFRTTGHRAAHLLCHNKKKMVNRTNIKSQPANLSCVKLLSPMVVKSSGAMEYYQPKANQSSNINNRNERPHKCTSCNKAFKKSSHLKQHVRSHTGERPFKCNVCLKSFITRGVLRAHMKIHTGVNDFVCTICQEKFTTKGSLNRHALKHSSERPFVCPYCKKSFKSLINCKKHIKTHRNEVAVMQQQSGGNTNPQINVDPNTQNLNSTTTEDNTTMPGLQTIEESISQGSFLNALQDQNLDAGLKQIDQDMVRNLNNLSSTVNLASIQAAPQPSYILTSPTNQGTQPDLQSPIQHQQQLSLVELGSLSVPNESGSLLVGPDQVSSSQPELTLFNLDMPSPNSANVINPSMFTDNMNILETGTTASQTIPQNGSIIITQTSLLPELSAENTHNASGIPTHNTSVTNSQHQQTEVAQSEQPTSTRPLRKTRKKNISYRNTKTQVSRHNLKPIKARPKSPETSSPGDRKGPFGGKVILMGSRFMYQCMGCEAVYTEQEFVKHCESFNYKTDLPYQCEHCCHRFKTQPHHESHVKFHSADEEVVYKCSKCGIGFTDKKIQEEHAQFHEQDLHGMLLPSTRKQVSANVDSPGIPHAQKSGRYNFFRLTEEQNKILSQTNPNLHMTVSERVLLSAVAEKDRVVETVVGKRGRHKPLEVDGPKFSNVCPHCPKSFRKQNDLVRHIRTHTGERPFKCKHCGKSFSVKSYLFSHEKTHSGIKSFRCHICNLMYSTKTSLKVHMRLHTGGLPYKCPYCPQKFRTSGHRKNHILSHFQETAPKRGRSKNKNKVEVNNTQQQSNTQTQQHQQQQQTVADVTLTLQDVILNPEIMQGDNFQLQWNGQTVQIVNTAGIPTDNLSIHLNPVALQELVNTSNQQIPVTTSQDVIRNYTQPVTTGPAPNLVIQPITLPDHSNGSGEQMLQEVNVAVPASLAPFTQILLSPTTNTNAESNMGVNNNVAMLQSLQQMLNSPPALPPMRQTSNDRSRKQINKTQDLTLVMNPNDQSFVTGGLQTFTLDQLLTSSDITSNQQFSYSLDESQLATTTS